jgi:large repetitive protein
VRIVRRAGLACFGVCVCLFGLTGLAPAKPHAKSLATPRVVLHWPNSPIRHKQRLRATNTTPSFSANLRGGVAFAGNTLETCPENQAAQRHRAKKRRHSLRRSSDSTACINANNNDKNMQYVNVDPGDGRFNSSSATLTVPAGARVAKAFLYWAGDLSEGVNRPTVNPPSFAAPANGNAPQEPGCTTTPPGPCDHPLGNTLWRTANLRVGSGSYTPIDATDPTRNGVWKGIQSWYQQPGQDPGFAYQVRADVTAEVSAGVAAAGLQAHAAAKNDPITVTVANVQAGKGFNRYAGWNLIVVWETPTAAFRNITIFDGFEYVQVAGGQQLVVGPLNFTGFSTPPSGPVDAQVTTWTTEGDRTLTGDYLALGPVVTNGLCTVPNVQAPLSDTLHPANNFFNSTISRSGFDDGDRTPNYSNQLGFDLATVDVPEHTIPNGADGASVCLGTTGDTYFFGGIVFSTLIYAPNLQIQKVANVSQAGPGDPVTYTTSVTNPQRSPDDPLGPTADATNLVVTDQLPSGLHFTGFVDSPSCTFDPAFDTITCNVGTLPAGGDFTYSFTATVAASAEGPAPNLLTNTACFDAVAPPVPGEFTGCDDATIIVPPTPPQPQPADLGVVKTVSAAVVAPGATITWKIVGTNYGPATSTGFTLADQLPPGVAFVKATAEAPLTCTTPPVGGSGAVTCTAPSVPAQPAAGSSLTLTIVATVPADTADGTLLQNLATVHGDQNEPAPDPHPNSDSTLTTVVVPDQPIPPEPNPVPPQPDGPPAPPVPQPPEPPSPDVFTARLSLHKSASPSVVLRGATVTFTLRVTNITEVSALKVRVCDPLPQGLTVVSAPGFTAQGRTLCTRIGELKAVASKTFRLKAQVGPGASSRIKNTATATASNVVGAVRDSAAVRVVEPPAVTG